MMQRFALFVDGSNLFGSLKSMNLEVNDYEKFFDYVHQQAVAKWLAVTRTPEMVPTQLRRIYWYVVGTMDHWDLTQTRSRIVLRKAFDTDRDIREKWMTAAAKADPTLEDPMALAEKAWDDCYKDFRYWYESKQEVVRKMHNFHQAIRANTNLIDVISCGHWKVNFLHKWVEEKGLDTSLAVDMVALCENYDVAVVASGDADSIPSIRYLKNKGKHVCAVEFVNGSPSEAKGRSFSSRLGEHSDFVVRIFEADLLARELARQSGWAAG
jgi:uncharacterized LabA/DUF88 family protein